MAPAQCPRQVLIWTLPAVAVLISFFWYKRRKASLRSDPGGTATKKTSEQLDIQCNPKNSCAAAVDSEQVIAAFEKAFRDVETSRAIQEVVSFEEAEEEVNRTVVESFVESNKTKTEDDSSSEIKIKSEQIDLITSTPLTQNSSDFTSIAALDSSIICCVIDTSKTTDNNISVITSNSDKSVIGLSSSDNTIIISSSEGSIIETSDSIESTSDSLLKENAVETEYSLDVKAAGELGGNKPVEAPVNGSYRKSNNKTTPVKKNSNKKSINKKTSVSSITNKSETKDITNKVKGGKEGTKKTILNGDCSKLEKEKFEANNPILAVTEHSATENPTMELSCSRVEQLGHNSGSSNVCSSNDSKNSEGGLEQKLATMGLESSHSNTESGERDSANHSPAEVMLASPSISNFSDAHSEGSSDSGKGCSDIPDISTPPAGGSSVAGDLVPSVYEFIIPQYMVGRLIGRYGGFLHDIRSKTHTNIFIKRHPDTMKLKICAIEGAQQDIDAALEMIRQKFPLRRFPNLTLERVTFVNIVPSLCPLQKEEFQLQLIEGVNNDVILSSLVTAGHFFLQQPTHPSYQSLCQLNAFMNSVYISPEAPQLDTPLKDAICAAPAMGGWYRAQIIDVDEENKSVSIRFLDYGGFLTLETSALRKIRGDLMLLPFQAVECILANVVPAGGEEAVWSEEARLFVQDLTCGQVLQAHISEYTEQGVPLVFLYAMYCGEVVIVNQELVNRGFAEAYTPEPVPVITEE